MSSSSAYVSERGSSSTSPHRGRCRHRESARAGTHVNAPGLASAAPLGPMPRGCGFAISQHETFRHSCECRGRTVASSICTTKSDVALQTRVIGPTPSKPHTHTGHFAARRSPQSSVMNPTRPPSIIPCDTFFVSAAPLFGAGATARWGGVSMREAGLVVLLSPWVASGGVAAATWKQRGSNMAATRQRHGSNIAAT